MILETKTLIRNVKCETVCDKLLEELKVVCHPLAYPDDIVMLMKRNSWAQIEEQAKISITMILDWT